MSVWVVSKTDMDALITIAVHWTEHGDLARLPAPAASVLRVTRQTASQVGARLWLANHNTFNYEGPPEWQDPEYLAELNANPELLEQMPDYGFEPLPGTPAPESAVGRSRYYRYQTQADYWDEDWWPDGRPPFEMLFTTAMEWNGLAMLGLVDPAAFPADGILPGTVDLSGYPRYEQSGWNLKESDRDLFLRLV